MNSNKFTFVQVINKSQAQLGNVNKMLIANKNFFLYLRHTMATEPTFSDALTSEVK